MKLPIVRYVPLVNHLARTFTAAPVQPVVPKGVTPPPDAAVASLKGDFEALPGFRPAIIVSDPAETSMVDLIVFKRLGDPTRSAIPETSQSVPGVPYDEDGAPGTYHFEGDLEETGKPELAKFDSMTVAQLTELAEKEKVDLGGATKKADIIAALTAAGK